VIPASRVQITRTLVVAAFPLVSWMIILPGRRKAGPATVPLTFSFERSSLGEMV
jgi:hypothetical protein